ncbi:MAG TPA: hypothetical protein VHE55_17375 [Fimbriimonadaceae bacterium]|nr:hypothetical protein [Fimbriimonadaceae bacterium]
MSLSAILALALGQASIGSINTFTPPGWSQYGGNPQHTSLSAYPAQPLRAIQWSNPVDYDPQYSGNDLLIHYGTPLITRLGTVVAPAKIGATDGIDFLGFFPDGTLKYILGTDYTFPPHGWTPSCAGCLVLGNYYLAVPGSAGTIYLLQNPDLPLNQPTQLCYYGMSEYKASDMIQAQYDANVKICTPLMSSPVSQIYFGVRVLGPTDANLESGFVQMTVTPNLGNFISVKDACGDNTMTEPVMNCAPALSNDGKYVYIVVSNGDFGHGYLVCMDTHTWKPVGKVRLKDPDGNDAALPDSGTASPMVGPDGDVYFGVLENPFPYNHDRGWMLHFNWNLKVQKPTGAFGWDDTASVVPARAVPSYIGSSPYLILTKYNNYAGVGGDGRNKVAILDPNSTQVDPITGNTVMKEVLTVVGVTPDPEFSGVPGAVREWCINSAAIDPFNKSAIINSEDGTAYRWNFTTNTLDQSIVLTPGIGEAYTPTLISPNGTAYAINNATLFGLGLPIAH